MTPGDALAFVELHGVVLQSAQGPVPRLAECVAGEPVKGSWWGHPKSRLMFLLFRAVADSPDILVCRLVGGKVTYVHRRLWPALIRAGGNFPARHLARVVEEHTASGHHVSRETAFPDWADPASLAAAEALDDEDALAALGAWAARS